MPSRVAEVMQFHGQNPPYISTCFRSLLLLQSRTNVVANPVRGLLDRKRSEEHLPSSNESKRKTQTYKNTTKRKEQE